MKQWVVMMTFLLIVMWDAEVLYCLKVIGIMHLWPEHNVILAKTDGLYHVMSSCHAGFKAYTCKFTKIYPYKLHCITHPKKRKNKVGCLSVDNYVLMGDGESTAVLEAIAL